MPNFQGIAPRFADRLLEDSQASFCTNLKVGSGDLRGFRSLAPIGFLTPDQEYRRAIKVYKTGVDAFAWFKSLDVNAHALTSPLAQDAFDRVYYTEAGATGLRVTTIDDLNAGLGSTFAGVDRPTVAPTVTPPVGGTPEPRAYVYTYANIYGSEGPPSPPTIQTGNISGTWTIAGFGTPPAGRGIDKIYIYRSATGEESSGDYYRVGTVVLPGTSFNDTMASTLVPLQLPLASMNYDPPPNGIKGIVQHSSGAIVGYIGRTVYCSEPYLPHAWPQDYTYPMDDEVMGVAPLLNSIVVLTKSTPEILSGNHPAQFAITKLPDVEPCTSHRSIVVMSNSVLFTSPNGLCAINTNGLTRPTNPLMTKEEFKRYSPSTIVAAAYGSYYVAFFDPSNGFAVALPPFEPVSFMPLDRYPDVTGIDTDSRTSDLIVLQGSQLSLFDYRQDLRFQTTWRSKEYIATYPINLGAVQILFKTDVDEDALAILIGHMESYNEDRFALGPLDTFNLYPICGEAVMPDPIPELSGLPPIQPLGGEPLYNIGATASSINVRFTLLADNVVRFTKIIADEKVHSMPEQYKATRFYVEVAGSALVQRIIVAETRRECRVA